MFRKFVDYARKGYFVYFSMRWFDCWQGSNCCCYAIFMYELYNSHCHTFPQPLRIVNTCLISLLCDTYNIYFTFVCSGLICFPFCTVGFIISRYYFRLSSFYFKSLLITCSTSYLEYRLLVLIYCSDYISILVLL